MSTRLQITEALRPVVASHRKAEKQTKGWDRLAPTSQCVILAASATNVTSILTSLPPTLHRFIKVRNATALQADCALTYAGNIIYLPTSFCQDLLQGHILVIPDPDAPTRLSALLKPPPSAGPVNSQKQAMRIQVLLSLGQNRFINRKSGKATVPEGTCPCVHARPATRAL